MCTLQLKHTLSQAWLFALISTYLNLTTLAGTLTEIVQLLTELGLNVKRARISSDGGWFVDEFHVQEDTNRKVCLCLSAALHMSSIFHFASLLQHANFSHEQVRLVLLLGHWNKCFAFSFQFLNLQTSLNLGLHQSKTLFSPTQAEHPVPVN